MPFLKEDLAGDHYNWNITGATSLFNGRPSRRAFDRYNGDQVLFIINSYSEVSEKSTVTEAHQIEDMISKELPLEAKSEISVFNWLRNTF